MALDGLAVAALAREFQEKLIDKRIDKISQPEHDEPVSYTHLDVYKRQPPTLNCGSGTCLKVLLSDKVS